VFPDFYANGQWLKANGVLLCKWLMAKGSWRLCLTYGGGVPDFVELSL